jgi:hypothetical protein
VDRSAWRLTAPLEPSLRKGLLAAIPVGVAIFVDLSLDVPAAGGVSTGALLGGFVAFDAPPRERVVWQLLTAPVLGAFAAIGALTAEPAWLAVVTMIVLGSLGGIAVAVSQRLAIAGMSCVLALLLAQGLGLSANEAGYALVLAAGGVALQVLVSLLEALVDRSGVPLHPIRGAREAWKTVRDNLTLSSPSFRHSLRWGTALGVGVGIYHALDLGQHGYWVPLTILFVLKPELGMTEERIAMRAAGSVLGLIFATPLAMVIGGLPLVESLAMMLAAGLCFALLALEYALFTAAITSFVVILSHAMGQSAWQAADQRAVGTAIGLAVAAVAFIVWSNKRLEERVAMPPATEARR